MNDKIATSANRYKWGAAAVVLLIVSPVLWVLSALLLGSLVASIATIAIGAAALAAAPVFSMKLANWRNRAIKDEATKNPIETLENLLLAKRQAFKQFAASVADAVTARNNFATKVEGYKKRNPARAPEFERALERMTDAVDKKKRALNDAQNAIEQGEAKLSEMRDYWEMSQALLDANAKTSLDTGDLYAKMKEDTASDAVVASVNRAFAELEVAASLEMDDAPTALPAPTQADVIDIHSTPIREQVRR